MRKLFILLPLILAGCQHPQVCFEEKCFQVEVPRTAEEKQQGLMFRENLAENKGMLFIFDESERHSFWMKNTKIPLDMIWIDKNGKVVHIHRNAQPCEGTCPSITPDEKAKYVLEINAGLAEKYDINENETARLSHISR